MKKGELSMSMIITAVIAIVILVIIIFLVIRSGKDSSNATSCPSKGGICVDGYCAQPIYGDDINNNLCSNGQTCCNPLSN